MLGGPTQRHQHLRSPSRWSWRWMGSSSRWSRRHYWRGAILSMASLISLPRVRPLARCQPCKYAERITNKCVLYVYYHYILLATWLLGGKIPPLRVGFCGLQHPERSSSRWPRRHAGGRPSSWWPRRQHRGKGGHPLDDLDDDDTCWREAILPMASMTASGGPPNKYYAKHTYSDTPL